MKDGKGQNIGCVLLLATLPLSAVWSGYVLSVLWGWFVVPTLGARPLSIPAAIGFTLVVRFLTHQSIPEDKTKTAIERTGAALALAAFWPLFALILGAVVRAFM